MALLLHFNEVSIALAASRIEADDVASKFATILVETRRRRGDVALLSSVLLPRVEISANYSLGQWGSHALNRDRWRLVRALQNRSPGWHLDSAKSSDEYLIDATSALGAANAHMSNGLLVSLATGKSWSTVSIKVIRRSLSENSDGDVEVTTEEVEVRNASLSNHLKQHLEWVSLAGMSDIDSGTVLAERWSELFPFLRILPRAAAQLSNLQSSWVGPVAQQLALMNRALAEWEGAAHPTWYTHVTPDSASRRGRGLLDFTDLDGIVRTFDLHARFTPGAGRVHFRLVEEERSAIVAHIGSKIT